MPFTFSHPALPLLGGRLPARYYSVSGAMAGSLMPDAEYFYNWGFESSYGHTPQGWVLLGLPLGVVSVLVWHLLVRDPLIWHLPAFFRNRFKPYYKQPWWSSAKKNLLTLVFSVLLGILSHALWDSFTHYDGYFVDRIPLLDQKYNLLGAEVGGYFILQLLFSILGLLILGWITFSLEAKAWSSNRHWWRYWALVGMAARSLSSL